MRFNIGDTVYHHEYGIGKIIKKSYFTHVNFTNYGIKRMLESYLEPVNYMENSEKESFICNIKSDMKGYVSQKRRDELYENNKLRIDRSSIDNLVKAHNKEFMEKEVEKYPDVFKTGEYDLNEEQKLAVVADVDNCLVIAGAGCGKTSMIVAKVNYLIHKGINPGKILVLSYTKKTVEDLNKKLGILKTNVNAKTFHSLGLSILGKGNNDKSYNDNINVGYILKKILNTESQKDSTSENKIIIENKNKSFEKIKELFLKFIAEHMENENDISNPIDCTNEKRPIKDYEKQQFTTLQAEIKYFENQNTSVKGESVKSLAEVKIANFLFLNDIEYEYANDDTKYGPDFIIKSGEKKLGLEHFSVTIDEHGNKHA
ncbi:MAG: AAA family ATPase, partial [Alphaproteobacteria bacterium]|nr:AAA family ATPase [Alphaproteobacteria bacterium]